MRELSVPPEGPTLDFSRWCRALVAEMRTMIPDVLATRRGKTVTLVRGEKEATIEDGGTTRWVTFGKGSGLAIERHDAHTARTAARTLAGHFEVKWAVG